MAVNSRFHFYHSILGLASYNENIYNYTFDTSHMVSDFPVPGGPIRTPVLYELIAIVRDK